MRIARVENGWQVMYSLRGLRQSRVFEDAGLDATYDEWKNQALGLARALAFVAGSLLPNQVGYVVSVEIKREQG